MRRTLVLPRLVTLVLALVAILVGIAIPSSALAADAKSVSCNSSVFSENGLLDPQRPAITNSVNGMKSKGATVRAIGLRSMGSASSLDNFVDSYTTRCGFGPVSSLRSNVIVVAFSVADHKTTIRFGNGWNSSLSLRYSSIEDDMAVPFKAGDYAGGMALGLQEVNSSLSSRPAQAPSNSSVAGQGRSSGSGIGWIVFGIIALAIILLVAAIVGIPFFLNRRREVQVRGDDRSEAQTQAKVAKGQANNAVLRLGSDIEALELRVNALPLDQVPDETMRRLRFLLDSVKRDFRLALSAYTDKDTSSADPTTPNLTAGQYRAIQGAYSGVISQVNDVRRQLGSLSLALDQLESDPKATVLERSTNTYASAASNGPAAAADTSRVTSAPTPEPTGSTSRNSVSGSDRVNSPVDGGPPSLGAISDEVRVNTAEAIRRADVDLSNAYSYFRTFGNYISERAWRHLDNAHDHLWDARSSRIRVDSTRRSHLRDAQDELRKAMNIARDDVQEERDYSSYRYYNRYGMGWFPTVPVIYPVSYGVPLIGYGVPFYGYDGEVREVHHDDDVWQTTYTAETPSGGGERDWTDQPEQPSGEEKDWTSQPAASGGDERDWTSSGGSQGQTPDTPEDPPSGGDDPPRGDNW